MKVQGKNTTISISKIFISNISNSISFRLIISVNFIDNVIIKAKVYDNEKTFYEEEKDIYSSKWIKRLVRFPNINNIPDSDNRVVEVDLFNGNDHIQNFIVNLI